MVKIINGKSIPNIPYEECPAGCTKPVWRYSGNPVIDVDPTERINRVFNSAVVPYEGGFIGVFRGDTNTAVPYLFLGRSKDGIHFQFEDEPIQFEDEAGNPVKLRDYSYDPRLIEIEGTYYIVWCDECHGPTISIAYTKDFKKFVKLPIPFLPYNRNGVLFPRKINGLYYMLNRPSDAGHTAFGDIFLSKSPDLHYWGDHQFVMERGYEWWNGLKIGPGSTPIETEEGWLLFFHGATRTCNGYVYSMGGVILDREDPSKVLYRCADFLLTPKEPYETKGYVDNVVFPTCALVDADTGRIAIYYGCADTYTSLAFTTVDKAVDYIKKHAR